jgi:LytS/YehU family sensor histidine kinase
MLQIKIFGNARFESLRLVLFLRQEFPQVASKIATIKKNTNGIKAYISIQNGMTISKL